jgi:CBS domain-containing protein
MIFRGVAVVHQVSVGDVMTREVVRVGVETPYRAIVDLLVERRISAVPVVDEANRVVGVVSEADLLHRVEFLGEEHERRLFERPSRQEARAKSHAASARDLMTSPAVTVTSETAVVGAARVMASTGVNRLPVVEADGTLVGIVARGDLLTTYVRPDDAVREDVVTTVVHDYLWIDPATVGVEVTDGVVTLTGTVDRRSTAAILARLTGGVPGVVEVVDRLAWKHDDAEEKATRFYRTHPFSTTTQQPQ